MHSFPTDSKYWSRASRNTTKHENAQPPNHMKPRTLDHSKLHWVHKWTTSKSTKAIKFQSLESPLGAEMHDEIIPG
jgi:hypothetical protein